LIFASAKHEAKVLVEFILPIAIGT